MRGGGVHVGMVDDVSSVVDGVVDGVVDDVVGDVWDSVPQEATEIAVAPSNATTTAVRVAVLGVAGSFGIIATSASGVVSDSDIRTGATRLRGYCRTLEFRP